MRGLVQARSAPRAGGAADRRSRTGSTPAATPFVAQLVDAVPRRRGRCCCSTSAPSTTPSWMQQVVLPAAAAACRSAPEAIGELLRGPARRRPIARGARRRDPRAHRRQPVLHRGDRPVAGRGRQPRGHARARIDSGRAARTTLEMPATVQAVLGGAHRPPAGAREAGAADRGGDRQGVRRAACCAGSTWLSGRQRWPLPCARARADAEFIYEDGALSGGRVRLQASADAGGGVRARSSRAAPPRVHAAVARALEATVTPRSSTSTRRCSRITGSAPARRSPRRTGTRAPPTGPERGTARP